jgi:hypothetical protein
MGPSRGSRRSTAEGSYGPAADLYIRRPRVVWEISAAKGGFEEVPRRRVLGKLCVGGNGALAQGSHSVTVDLVVANVGDGSSLWGGTLDALSPAPRGLCKYV